ncbi:MAG: glycosyltransferase family 39 protein [Candidatus Margulisbacteria bacterium]|nr:glycosyltransferase family 39 protein [Candidatus Margulisiibacteriota bacterium]
MSRNHLFLILILTFFLVVSFLTLPRNPLLNDDASAYALAAKNMIVHNQWLAPLVTPGDPSSFFDKPPLGLWLLAWLPKIVGINELTIHLPNILYYLVILLILFFFLARLASKKIALYSTLITATSLVLIVYSRAPKLDVLLTLFVMTANLSLYAFLRRNNPICLLVFTISLACGFLVKAGFGIILPVLTLLFLIIFNPADRKKLLNARVTRYALLYSLLSLLLIAATLGLQSLALKDQFIPYLKSITITSKYNTGYLGLGFYYSIIGFLLLTVFPWTPLALTALKLRWQKPNLNVFCNIWFWSNFLFLLFFYKQSDLRTFTVFVPPLAILAGIRLISLGWKPRRLVSGFQLFFLSLFALLLITLLIKPVNPQGFSLVAAIIPIACFVAALTALTIYFWRPSKTKLAVSFALVCLAYSVLFYNTKPIADDFNPDLKWPALVSKYRAKGYKFYIYRPHDRNLFYSPDLQYVDFITGPADGYLWGADELNSTVRRKNTLILSDKQSWDKITIRKNVEILASDSYSLIIKVK